MIFLNFNYKQKLRFALSVSISCLLIFFSFFESGVFASSPLKSSSGSISQKIVVSSATSIAGAGAGVAANSPMSTKIPSRQPFNDYQMPNLYDAPPPPPSAPPVPSYNAPLPSVTASPAVASAQPSGLSGLGGNLLGSSPAVMNGYGGNKERELSNMNRKTYDSKNLDPSEQIDSGYLSELEDNNIVSSSNAFDSAKSSPAPLNTVQPASKIVPTGVLSETFIGHASSSIGILEKDEYYVQHTLRAKENIKGFAKFFNVSVEKFKSLLDFDVSEIKEGLIILIPIQHYKLKKKDTLQSVSDAFGISVNNISKICSFFEIDPRNSKVLPLPLLDDSRKILKYGQENVVVEDKEPASSSGFFIESEDDMKKVLPEERIQAEQEPVQLVASVVVAPIENPFKSETTKVLDIKETILLPIHNVFYAVEKKSSNNVVNVLPIKKEFSSASKESALKKSATNKDESAVIKLETTFVWPIKRRNENVASDIHSDGGVDIYPTKDLSVYAAMSGEIVYVGNDISMYSQMIIIQSPNGYITIYGNNSSISVRRGDVVKQGQVIGKIGKTKNVKEPRLYFAVRYGKKIVDPLSIFN